MLDTDYNGALKHVRKHFGKWTRRIAKAVISHKKNEHTVAARERSQHGLNPEELSQREARDTARRNLDWAKTLENELVQAKGEAKAKGKPAAAMARSGRRQGSPLDAVSHVAAGQQRTFEEHTEPRVVVFFPREMY